MEPMATTTTTCYRHPSRETGVACSNCGRPICPDCMTPTQVGMRCPECAGQTTRVTKLRRTSVAAIPRVTYTLIAINVIAFLGEQGQFSFSGTGIHGTLINEGILYRAAIHEGHQYWRLITSAFLHENFIHIAFNMYLLYLLGRLLEPAIGSARFAAIYTVALLAGSFGVLLATPFASLGASGAIFGLMGGTVVELRARGISVMESGIGGLIIINLIISFTFANISVGAHIGGLIGGTLAALTIRAADSRPKPMLGFAGCLALCVVAVAGSLAAAGATGTGFA
jgi:membrane associated rhomboid family serine protease